MRAILKFLLLIFLISFNSYAQCDGKGSVVISEVYFDTHYSEKIDSRYHHFGEYIELFNSSDEQVDLRGWTIRDNHTEFVIAGSQANPNTVIEPGGTKVIIFGGFYAGGYFSSTGVANGGLQSAIGAREKFVELFPQAAGHEDDIIVQDKIVLYNNTDKISLYSANNRLIHEISYKNGGHLTATDQVMLDYMGIPSFSADINLCNWWGGTFNGPIGYVPVLDANGDPMLDASGNPIFHMNYDYLNAIYLSDPQDYYFNSTKTVQVATATPFSIPFSIQLEPLPPIFFSVPIYESNWSHSISYNINGDTIGESRTYFNDLGKSTVSLSKDFLTDKVWGSSVEYDSFGRLSKQSFPTYWCYQFEPMDFLASEDLINRYSNNNTTEPYQATATHPYSQTNYDTLNPDNVINVVGGNQINGQWINDFSYTMPAAQEMYYAFGKNYYDGPIVAQGEEVITRFYKTVAIDAHGVENVVFTDGEGKTLASARSGSGTQYPVVSLIGTQGYVDVHIPAGTTGATLIGNNPTNDYRVYDLRTGNLYTGTLQSGNVYRIETVNVPTTDPKTYITSTGSITFDAGALGITYNVNYKEYSLNYYNSIGQLTKVVQPKGYQQNTTVVAAPTHGLISTYSYNTLGQVISITSPDEDYNNYAYRNDGQIRFSYNEIHANNTSLAYTNYDTYGRPIENGLCDGDWGVLSQSPDDPLSSSLSRWEQTITIYDYSDNYIGVTPPPISLQSAISGTGLNQANYIQKNLSGNVAVTYTLNPHTSATWYSYDIYGRVEWMVQNITGLGVKTVHYYYDANDNVKEVMFQKDVASEMFVHRYTYNLNGALITAEISTDNNIFKKQADYEYYLDGKLKRVVLANGLQGTDYVYTLGGMLKSINHPSLDPAKDPGQDGNDVFGLTIDYYSGDYLRSGTNIGTSSTASNSDNYDGNIKAIRFANKSLDVPNPNMVVSSTNKANQKAYLYTYNNNKWLNAAVFGDVNATYNFGDETSTINPLTKFKEYNITYDSNGNIISLQRTKEDGTMVDKLGYNYYPGMNQLSSVSDLVGTSSVGDYDLPGQNANNYRYDQLGRLSLNIKDNLQYTYTTSGLVDAIFQYSPFRSLVRFYYNERGQRIKKESYNPLVANQLVSTDYYVLDAAGNAMAVYTKSASGTLSLNEYPIYGMGRLGMFSKQSGKEKYELTDHLGNVRAVIQKPDLFANPFSIMMAYADYYALGEQLPTRNSLNNNYRYAFQGQEKDGETGMEAFKLRLWDGRIGRWLNPDPYGQYDSPYLGMGNNPVSRIDPDGGSDYPDRDGFGCGETWNDADGSWIWDSDIRQWVGQDGFSGNVLANLWVVKGEQPTIKAYETNFFGKIENLLQFKNANLIPNSKIGPLAILMGKYSYSMFDNAYVYGTRNFYNNPENARHLNGQGASKEEVVEAGLSTIQTIMPSPIKGRFSLPGATKSFIPKYNVATFGTTFKGTFITKLAPSTRGALIRYTNLLLIQKTNRAGLIGLTKKGANEINK